MKLSMPFYLVNPRAMGRIHAARVPAQVCENLVLAQAAIWRFLLQRVNRAVFYYMKETIPVLTLVTGILLLLMPNLLSYFVAIYLIILGISGLLRK